MADEDNIIDEIKEIAEKKAREVVDSIPPPEAPIVNVEAPVVNVPAPIVKVSPPVVNVPAPIVKVEAPVVNVEAPESNKEVLQSILTAVTNNKPIPTEIDFSGLSGEMQNVVTAVGRIQMRGGGGISSKRTLLDKRAIATNPWEDYNLQVLMGNVVGHTMVSINGEIETLTTTRVTIAPTLTTTDIDQSGLHATAATVDVASDSATDDKDSTGLRTLRLFGLDSNGNAQNEIITLEGQAEQTSANTYSAIQGWRGLTTGSGNTSVGNIFIGNGTFTSGVPDTIYFVGEAGHNKGLTCYYTVPTATSLFLRAFNISMVGSNKEAKLHVETSSDGIFWITEREIGLESGGLFRGDIIAVPSITGGNHLRITGIGGASGTELAVVLSGELVDD